MRDNPYHNTVILGGKIEVDYDLIQTLVSCIAIFKVYGVFKTFEIDRSVTRFTII
jgi:hypothetical protein